MHKLTATAAATLVALATTTGAATEPVNEDVVARLKVEGFQNSQVMETLSWLSDVYGPRLSGSDNLRKAGEWARDQMTRWGLQHAALEPYDSPIFAAGRSSISRSTWWSRSTCESTATRWHGRPQRRRP